MTAGEDRRWWLSPAATTIGVVVLAGGIFLGIQWIVTQNATDRSFVDGQLFRIWLAFATVTLTIWIALFNRGVAMTRTLPWQRSRTWWAANLAAYAALAVLAVFLLTQLQGRNVLPVPIQGWRLLIGGLALVGLTAAAPWLLVIWLANEQAHRLQSLTERIPLIDVDDEWSASDLDGRAVSEAIDAALVVWRAFRASVLALAPLISVTVLLNAALRAALIGAGIVTEESFPQTAVLGYGLFAAVLLAVAVLPLLLAYRAQVARLVDRAVGQPRSGVPSQAWLEARGRLQTRLNVETNLLRQVSTGFGLLAPLVTAVLAALVPT